MKTTTLSLLIATLVGCGDFIEPTSEEQCFEYRIGTCEVHEDKSRTFTPLLKEFDAGTRVFAKQLGLVDCVECFGQDMHSCESFKIEVECEK